MTPAEISAAIAVFQILEPQAQKVIAGLIHALHHQQMQTASDYIAEAEAIVAAKTTAKG